MIQRLIFVFILAIGLVGCQFTETMIINENGGGRMSIEMDMSEMMAFGGDFAGTDSTITKVDSIISMKELLEEKKDSISQLSAAEQAKLKKLENYNIHMVMDSETNQMVFDVFTEFKSVEEANDLLNGLSQGTSMMPGSGMSADTSNEAESPEILGVSYSFKKGKFKRDGYIKDVETHKRQVDSLKSMEGFMSSMKYRLKYTFPSKIIKSSNTDATFSLDGKTIEMEASFIEYFKDPDILDLEIEIEN